MKQLIFLVLVFGFSGCCFHLSHAIYYFDDNTAARCGKCCTIKNISKEIEYLDIVDWNCYAIPEDWNFPGLKTLIVNSNEIRFPAKPPSSNLEIVSILDPILDSVPSFIFETKKLESLIIFLYNDKCLNNNGLSGLKNLKSLKIGLSDMLVIPDFIYALDSLEELIIFSNNPNEEMVFSEDLLKLESLKRLEAPVELSRNINVIGKMPGLKELRVKSLLDFEANSQLLTELNHIEELCIEDILPKNQASLYYIIPSVEFICHNWHITPLDWEKLKLN